MPNPSSFQINHTDGRADPQPDLAAVWATLRAEYGDEIAASTSDGWTALDCTTWESPVVPGDPRDRLLVWRDAASSIDDDGAHAVAEVVPQYDTPEGWTVYHRSDAGDPAIHSDGEWYYAPEDGAGGGVYSPGYPTRVAAVAACLAWYDQQAIHPPTPAPTAPTVYECTLDRGARGCLRDEDYARVGEWGAHEELDIETHALLVVRPGRETDAELLLERDAAVVTWILREPEEEQDGPGPLSSAELEAQLRNELTIAVGLVTMLVESMGGTVQDEELAEMIAQWSERLADLPAPVGLRAEGA